MERRRFLQQSGLAVAGGAGVLVPTRVLADAAAARAATNRDAQPQQVLVTAAETPLAQALAEGLPAAWQVQLTAATEVSVSRPFTKCALEADESTRDVVRGMDAIVHVALAQADRNPSEQIDGLVRATYNLLTAAAAEGVRRVVHVGSLSILRGYDEAFAVAEDWQPRPGDDAPALAEYLAECASREFARQRQLEVVALRIGKVVRAESVTGQAFDPLWVDQRDVVQAVSLALRTAKRAAPRGTDGWTVLHILSDSPRARYSVNKARQVLGYQPQHRW
ncbi:MAG: NAD(P)-dependent oxidoreductase [Pirellulaceae bacterium]|jgi:uronate dehydrogenase|nr:NAD(P)-dependent oxidoreductase [Pirellulaceae bacterium]